jgi:hypothetical protein
LISCAFFDLSFFNPPFSAWTSVFFFYYVPVSAMVETQLGCTEEETTALVENSNEAAAAQGLEPIASAGHGVSFAAAVSVVVAAATSLLM